MTNPRIQQLHQSGATVGQVATWDGTTWVPATPSPIAVGRGVFTALAGESVIYLGATPITDSEFVYVDGLLLTPGVDYTLTGSTITLTTPLSGGEVVVVLYSTTGAAGTPDLVVAPTGFTRPVAVTRPVHRFHRIR